MNTISINGVTYTGGNSISVVNGKVIIDGKDMTPDHKEINITVHGNIDQLEVGSCNSLSITGDCGQIKSGAGDIEITGNVGGSVSTKAGDIKCGNVGGSVSTMTGDIKHRKS